MASAEINVSNSKQLLDALKHASGGETIYLAGGSANYSLALTNMTFDKAVTLKSLDLNDKAVFESIKLDKVTNLTVDGVEFDSAGVQRASWMTDLFVENSHNISVLNSTMTSSASAFNDGHVTVGENAVRVKNTDGFVFQNNEVSKYNLGLQITGSENVKIVENNIHHLQADGLQFSDVDNVLIDGNNIHDFYASLFSINHNDMIQFFTTGTKSPSENVVIRNNILDSGSGNFTQSIFFGNEAVAAGAGKEMFYKNVLVENNTIYNNNFHGITFYQTDGLTIRDNSVLLNQTTPLREFNNDSIYITVKPGSLGVTVTDNVAGKMQIESLATLSNNITLDYKNPNAANYYLKVLDLSDQTDKSHVDGIKLLSDSGFVQDLIKSGLALGSGLLHVLQPSASAATLQIHSLEGTAGNDTLKGTVANDVIRGGGGGDRLSGEGGHDAIYGGDGDDTLQGGGGNDFLDGGNGRDQLSGGIGNDELHGRAGDDRLYGDDGNDSLFGEAGNDSLYGSNGNDQLSGGDGADALRGEAGNDVLHGGAGDDMLWGGDGNDTLNGGSGRDNYYGGAGKDAFVMQKGEIQDDRINDYSSKDDTIVFNGFGKGVYADRVAGSIFEIHDTDGSTAQFRVTVTDGGPIHWVFA